MRGAAVRRPAMALLVLAVIPVAAYLVLVGWMRAHGAATVMLGAASGSSGGAVAAMGAALLLRVYTVVVMPGVLVAWRVMRVGRARRAIPPPDRSPLRGPPRAPP